MGVMQVEKFLETPNMDRLAAEGARFKNAFVTTALCSHTKLTCRYQGHDLRLTDVQGTVVRELLA